MLLAAVDEDRRDKGNIGMAWYVEEDAGLVGAPS